MSDVLISIVVESELPEEKIPISSDIPNCNYCIECLCCIFCFPCFIRERIQCQRETLMKFEGYNKS